MKFPALFRRLSGALCIHIFFVGAAVLAVPSTATATAGSGETPAAAESPTPSLIPPYAGDDPPRPVRTRQDRIVSTIAPIGMVVVLIAGLYVYWLIRKGL